MEKHRQRGLAAGALLLVVMGLVGAEALAAGGPAVWLPLVSKPGPNVVTRLKAPAGFQVELYASGLSSPRLMTFGPRGLYVAERGAGRITLLADTNNDGAADTPQYVATGLNGPHNTEWFNGSLYVAENDKIRKMTDSNNDGDFLDAGEQTVVTTNIPSGGGHSSRTVHFGPDGKMYVAAGSSTNNTVETDKRRATIMRFNPDGTIPSDNPFANDSEQTRRPVWAEGLRNSVDFVFMPDGKLWADHNGSDGLGNDNPPEEVVIDVQKGKHYGWPYCYTPTEGAVPAGTKEVPDPTSKSAATQAQCDSMVPALFTAPAHQAPLGMTYYADTGFPAEYRNDLYIAYHGSWNADSTPRDCKVQRVVVENGVPVRSEDFLTGFRDNDQIECANAWGRPAGVAVGPNGELFVSDDKNGNIYRVVYVGT